MCIFVRFCLPSPSLPAVIADREEHPIFAPCRCHCVVARRHDALFVSRMDCYCGEPNVSRRFFAMASGVWMVKSGLAPMSAASSAQRSERRCDRLQDTGTFFWKSAFLPTKVAFRRFTSNKQQPRPPSTSNGTRGSSAAVRPEFL